MSFRWCTHLSDSDPNMNEPNSMPNMKQVCVKLLHWARSHTKFQVVTIVSVKTLRSYSHAWHSVAHLSSVWFAHENATGGASKMTLNWFQAIGNLTNVSSRNMHICHFSKLPMVFCIGSVSSSVGDGGSLCVNEVETVNILPGYFAR